MGKELFLEIGTEEIPAAFLQKALEDMKEMAASILTENHLQHGAIQTMGTPRRLCLVVADLHEKQDDMVVEKLGPAKKAAFDANGQLTPAAQGFAKSQSVDFSAIETVTTDKGEYLCVRKQLPGAAAMDILPPLLLKLVTEIPFRKSMRWSDYDFRFARPIHWIAALYGAEIVPFAVEDIASGNSSRGHRFMSNTSFVVSGFTDYLEKARANYVIVDPEERKKIILEEIHAIAAEVGGKPIVDPDLLDTVTFLVEYPNAVCGSFSSDYLKLPREVLITSMISHQKYFPVVAENNDLMAHFITINNTRPRDPALVRRGNEKVIRARLSDADFFFQEDQKTRLDDRVEDLKQVIFHTKLGTSFEKVQRFRQLALYLADQIDPALCPLVDRTAYIAKADLDTRMVGEFPELQGIMGREYSLREGENPLVAQAVYEHYLPIAAAGALPETEPGAIVSIADKLDTIAGFFGVNVIPSGTADPYALRRQAIGIINIILHKKYNLDMGQLTDASLRILGEKITRPPADVKKDVLDFFRNRFEYQMGLQGFSYDVIHAVMAANEWNLYRCGKKIKALEAFKTHTDFLSLTAAVKRVENISKGFSAKGSVDPDLFENQTEADLFSSCKAISATTLRHIREEDFSSALGELTKLKEPIDLFFDAVLVMAKEEKIKHNRLFLLREVSSLFHGIADFTYISTDN
ncbi:MAG: glycine--tRNA ligase subunit beta [Syntrophobacterales bacterium]|jgi:glycyl-tRNA synthetase beta chain|nr:glycine--tRNA ligase subunit beta [Syntrophobacterales bacterium]